MLSKFAKEQDIKPNEPISVSPTTGYTSWFTIWNTKKEEKEKEKEEDNKSDTSEIFKLSEDETSKLPVDIEVSDYEMKDTDTENSDDESCNSEHVTAYDKYLGSKRCMIDDNELPYNYSLLYEEINKTKSICNKIVNDNIQRWNNSSDAFKIYAVAISSIYLGIAEPVAMFFVTYAFMDKFVLDERKARERFSPVRYNSSNEAETADNEESSDCAADSEQD